LPLASRITAQLAAQQLQARRAARLQVEAFVAFTKPDYLFKAFHQTVCDYLDRFERREIRKMMVLLPPQHGKTELVTRRYTAYRLGTQPDTKMAICSFGAEIAEGFGRDVQRIIDSDAYRALFPDTRLSGAGTTGTALRNAAQFEIVGRQGFVKALGAGGPLNSTTVDLGITDDLYKDRAQAKSRAISESRWEWYQEVFETRFHNQSQQLLCNTRWDEYDVAGRLLARDGEYSETNPNGWVVLKFEGIKTGEPSVLDPRRAGEALFPERHSLEKLLGVKQSNPIGFNSLYQQDPRPSVEALVYPMWQQVPAVPETLQHVTPYYGLDFGFTNDPTALVRIYQHNHRVCADEVMYGTGMSNAEIKLAYLSQGAAVGALIFADAAEPKTIADLRQPTLVEATAERQAKYPTLRTYLSHASTGAVYRLPGLNVVAAVKGPDSVHTGISLLREDVEVVVTQRSTHIWAERNRYEFILHDGKSTNVPRDRDNHTMDAIRYAVYSHKVHKPFLGLSRPAPGGTGVF